MLTPLSALNAFRQDIAATSDSATDDDARWLQIVSLLQSAVDVPPADRRPILNAVTGLALSDCRTPAGDARVPPVTLSRSLPEPIDCAVRAAAAMEDATRLHLAYSAYDTVLRLIVSGIGDERFRAEVQGTVLSLQGRVARQLGDMATSKERYRGAEEVGTKIGSVALVARAWVGYGRIAQTRGNLPQAREWFTKVLTCAGAARESLQVAHQSLMVAASAAGDYQTAARHGWAAYELSADAEDASAALCDLSELMRVSGRPQLALRGFSAALQRASAAPRRQFAALGGAAMAAAQALPAVTALPIILAYKEEIDALITATHLPYSHASVLADLGDALALIGQAELCDDSRARAKFIARAHGFFELLFRVTDDAIPVSGRDAVPVMRSETAASLQQGMEEVAPVLDALAAFTAPPEIEAALAG